jgi:hypothetical protein
VRPVISAATQVGTVNLGITPAVDLGHEGVLISVRGGWIRPRGDEATYAIFRLFILPTFSFNYSFVKGEVPAANTPLLNLNP